MAVKVLILEDDQNLGESLKEFFTQELSAQARWVRTAGEAEQIMTFDVYDLLVVDLVLVDIHGLDFLHNIIKKNLFHANLAVWCISGILDRGVIPGSLYKQVQCFFKKPLDMDHMAKAFSERFDSEQKSHQFFYMKDHLNFSCSDLLKNCRRLPGRDLMFLYIYLCYLKFTGCLDVSHRKGQAVKFFFQDGRIFDLKVQPRHSYLGEILIQNKIISKKALYTALERKGRQLLGNYLINQCLVSPHLVQESVKKQLVVYLSKSLDHKNVSVQFSEEGLLKTPEGFIYLDFNYDILPLSENWLQSKVSVQWIKSFFADRESMIIRPIKQHLVQSTHGNVQMMQSIFLNPISHDLPVSSLIKMKVFQSDSYMRELYYRLLVKNCYLTHREEGKGVKNASDSLDNSQQLVIQKKLTQFIKKSRSKNYFELLQIPMNAGKDQVTAQYKSIVKTLHPDSIINNHSPELQRLYEQSLSILSKAYNTLNNSEKRRHYMAGMTSKIKSQKSTLQLQYKEAKQLLKDSCYEEAFQRFSLVLREKLNAPKDAGLFKLWADLKRSSAPLNEPSRQKLAAELKQLSAGGSNADVLFVYGLLNKRAGKEKEALAYFNKALLVNPNMVPAAQEKYSIGLKQQPGGG